MSDLLLTRALNPMTGKPSYDITLTAAGDIATISGSAKLAQDVLLFLDTPLGSNPFMPTWGSPFWADIGHPIADTAFYEAQLQDAATAIIAWQARQVLPFDEQLATIDNVSIRQDPNRLGILYIDFRVTARSGDSREVTTTA